MQTIVTESLDAEARNELRASLRFARKAGEAVIIDGYAKSWNHRLADGEADDAKAHFHDLLLSVLGHPAPVVTVLRGDVTGFGTALAAVADGRLVDGEVRISTGPISVALTTGSYRALWHLLGRARADSLVYGQRSLTTQEAEQWSLLTVPFEETIAAQQFDSEDAKLLKRAATAGLVPKWTEQLEYDAWLAKATAGVAP